MSQINFIPPTLQAQAFNCPRCRVFAQQKWLFLHGHKTITEPREVEEIYNGLPADKLAGIEKRDKK